MDAWDHRFATTGAELDVQEALMALERVLGRPGLSSSWRVRLEEAASALREIEAGPRPASPLCDPDSEKRSQPL